MNVLPQHCYLPPIQNPSLLPSSKDCLQLWKEHKLSFYLLISQKNYQQLSTLLLRLWLSHFSLTDPLFLSIWIPYSKFSLESQFLPHIPRQIQLWNHYDSRLICLHATQRWSIPNSIEPHKIPIKWKAQEHTAEGMIQRWGNLPDFQELPLPISFFYKNQWATPWKMLFRGLIIGAFQPNLSFLTFHDWDGWGWIAGWISYCQKNMGNLALSSIYPQIRNNELKYPCNHPSWTGLAIGWDILENIMQVRQIPDRKQQDWLMKRFRLARKAWLSPFLFFSTDHSPKQTTLLYQFIEWTTWTVLQPRRFLENAHLIQNYGKEKEAEWISDHLTLGQIYHQTACQDRSYKKIRSEYLSCLLKNDPDVIENVIEEKPILPKFIPKKGELDYRRQEITPSQTTEREFNIQFHKKQDNESSQEEENDDEEENIDLDEMSQWINKRKNISHQTRSEEQNDEELLSGRKSIHYIP